MKKLLVAILITATWMVVGCETVRQVKAGCWGHWVDIMLNLIDNVWTKKHHI
jgi:hypothetical protein